jgi:hypothetical protein
MRDAFRPWGKSQTRETRASARRCGAGFQVNGTKIERVPTCTKLARMMFCPRDVVRDLGAKAC